MSNKSTGRPLDPKSTEIAWTPQRAVYRALKVLQDANLNALRARGGHGNTTQDMVEILDRELGFSDLYAALEKALPFAANSKCQHVCDLIGNEVEKGEMLAKVMAALAKAKGESDAG